MNAVLKDSNAVSCARRGFEVGTKRATNYYIQAIAQARALKEEIHQFLEQVVGPEPENLDLVKEILAETRRST